MIVNIQSLKQKAKNFAIENDLTVQQVLQNYIFERFLERLSKSSYSNKFIIKGGLLLSSIMGINLRTTMDIDADIIGINFEKSDILQIVNEIIDIQINDNVEIKLEKIEDIIEDNEYGGYKLKLIAKLSNLTIPFHIDVSTGDIITPKAIEYKYKTILENKYIDILTYNYETIIAEKFQTILSRKIANSRMKDFYDIYYFVNNKWNEINSETLKQAINNTFIKRESLKDLENATEIIKTLLNDINLPKLWKDYKVKHNYARNIEYEQTIQAIEFVKNSMVLNLHTYNKIDNTCEVEYRDKKD